MAFTRISKIMVVSRLCRGIFTFGMLPMSYTGGGGRWQGNGSSECVELTFCKRHKICYKYNRLDCDAENCTKGRHICKMCWRLDQTVEHYHASDDQKRCPNMSLDYRNSLNGVTGDEVDQDDELTELNSTLIQSSERGRNPAFQRRSVDSQSGSRGRDSSINLRSALSPRASGSGVSYQRRSVESPHMLGRGGSGSRGRSALTPQQPRSGFQSQRGTVESPSQLSRRGSVTSIQGGHAPTGRSSHSINQPLDLTANARHSHLPNLTTSPRASQSGGGGGTSIEREDIDPRRKNDYSGTVMDLREDIVNLKNQIVETKADLLDEKYQHQMLQVRYAELDKKNENLEKENLRLQKELDRNRQMQRLFNCFKPKDGTGDAEMRQEDFNVHGRFTENTDQMQHNYFEDNNRQEDITHLYGGNDENKGEEREVGDSSNFGFLNRSGSVNNFFSSQ